MGFASLFLDLMAQPLQKATGLHMRDGFSRVGSAPLLGPSLSSSTHSLTPRGCEAGPVSTARPPFLRKESYESTFNLVLLARYLAEIPQSWWHIDGTLSHSPVLKQIPPYF